MLYFIDLRIKYQPDKANITTNALNKSKSYQKENQKIDKSTQRRSDRDLEMMMIQALLPSYLQKSFCVSRRRRKIMRN